LRSWSYIHQGLSPQGQTTALWHGGGVFGFVVQLAFGFSAVLDAKQRVFAVEKRITESKAATTGCLHRALPLYRANGYISFSFTSGLSC
jgi:hypothetical protein